MRLRIGSRGIARGGQCGQGLSRGRGSARAPRLTGTPSAPVIDDCQVPSRAKRAVDGLVETPPAEGSGIDFVQPMILDCGDRALD
jgi:hypothetical protein